MPVVRSRLWRYILFGKLCIVVTVLYYMSQLYWYNIMETPEAMSSTNKGGRHSDSARFVAGGPFSSSVPVREPNCKPKKNIVFLKTHKCASTSIQNIFLRYGDTHNLTFVLPPKSNMLGLPRVYDKNESIALPSAFSSEYNILCHHVRWHEGHITSIMPNDTVYITIVREPVAMFESTYQYFKYESHFNQTLDEYMENPLKSFFTKGKWPHRVFAWNPMAYDFGFDTEDNYNPKKILDEVPLFLKKIDFVLDADRFRESLVMLKDFLCWDWMDVLTFRHNMQSEPRPKASSMLQEKIRDWNAIDVMIYDGFMEKFNGQLAKYTSSAMSARVEMIKRWYGAWMERCLVVDFNTRRSVEYLNEKLGLSMNDETADHLCTQLVKLEMNYTDELRDRLWPDFNVTKLSRESGQLESHGRNTSEVA